MRPTCAVIVNPRAGGLSPVLLDEIVARCRSLADVEVLFTATAGDAVNLTAEIAAKDPPDSIVVVGGDGTTRQAAEGLACGLGRWDGLAGEAGGPVLSTIPAGTGNSWYRALWGETPWQEMLPMALGGYARVRDIDLARITGGGAVLLGASSGYIAVVTQVALRHHRIAGRERYRRAMAEVLESFQPYEGRVTVDGMVVHEGSTALVTVGGARHRVGAFEVLPRSELDDGLLDLCVLDGDLTGGERDAMAAAVMSGTHVGRKGVVYQQGAHVVIERTDGEPLAFERDGDVWDPPSARIDLAVVPHAVPFSAPVTPVAG